MTSPSSTTSKPNVHWQDKAPLNGRQFVAEDAAFGIQRFGQDNPEFVWRDRYSSVEQFEVTDDLTLTLKTSEVFAPLLSAIGETQAVMVSRDAVEAFGDDGIASNIEAAVGTGGMQHVSREDGVVTVLERNPNYFREGLPYFDGFRANWNADGAYRARAVRRRRVRHPLFSVAGLPGGERGRAGPSRREENLVEVPMNATWGWIAVHFHTKVVPYTDPRVRLALHLATDREQLIVTTQGVTEMGGADLPRGRPIRVHPRRAPPAARLSLRRPARGGPGRRPAAARRQRLRPGERAADERQYWRRNPVR